jgi:putative MFS transporter
MGTVAAVSAGDVIARIERLPVSRRLLWTRIVVGTSTFFDAYTTLSIAYAMPVLVRQWALSAHDIGYIISAGYLGQLVGALGCGWLADRYGRRPLLIAAISLFAIMSLACLLSWNAASMSAFRFVQGIGTGAEVPIASAYINEFIGAKKRGRFFLLYELIFPIGLLGAGLIGYFLVPLVGWRSMFYVGVVPAVVVAPLFFFMDESPRWLLGKGRTSAADAVVRRMENELIARGVEIPPPAAALSVLPLVERKAGFSALFKGIYLKRTLMLWCLWFCVYLINNGLITWLPTLYRQIFHLPLQTSIMYGFITSGAGVIASLVCALYIDRVGRKRWYVIAFFAAIVPLGTLGALGKESPVEMLVFVSCSYAILQTVAFSIYLYTAELYPTRMRAIGSGMGSAWLRIGSSVGPLIVGMIVPQYGISAVFILFTIVALFGGLIVLFFAQETRGRVLEEVSP